MEQANQQQLDEEYDALDDAPDFLDEFVADATARNPAFPALMEEARQRRALLHELAAVRTHAHIAQKTVAERMETSQPAIARLEAGEIDPRLSTVQRYAASIGKRVRWQIVDADV